MSNYKTLLFIAWLVVGVGFANGQEESSIQAVEASKEHQWLHQFVGEWEIGMGAIADPSQPAANSVGSESARLLGENWLIAEGKLQEASDVSVTFLLTLGYDPGKKKYVGSWICSHMSVQWVYEGTVNESGNTLTLEAEGPNPALGGKLSKFRDVIEFKNKDLRVHTSFIQEEDGKWTSFQTVNYRRKK